MIWDLLFTSWMVLTCYVFPPCQPLLHNQRFYRKLADLIQKVCTVAVQEVPNLDAEALTSRGQRKPARRVAELARGVSASQSQQIHVLIPQQKHPHSAFRHFQLLCCGRAQRESQQSPSSRSLLL